MDLGPKPPVTWESVLHLARALEDAALRNNVRPDDGARLVRLVLQFEQNISGSVRRIKASSPPPPSDAL